MPVHHLERTLKRLKLSGILATLEERLEQGQRQQLGYVEFLTLLLEVEVARRGQKDLALRVGRARFEEVKTPADFDFKANPQIPVAQIRDLATLRFLERQESILICGPVGVGKSVAHRRGPGLRRLREGVPGPLRQDASALGGPMRRPHRRHLRAALPQ